MNNVLPEKNPMNSSKTHNTCHDCGAKPGELHGSIYDVENEKIEKLQLLAKRGNMVIFTASQNKKGITKFPFK